MENPFLLWHIRLWIILGNLLTLAFFLTVGWLVDHWLGTSPKALIACLVVSFPLSQAILIKLLMGKFGPKKAS